MPSPSARLGRTEAKKGRETAERKLREVVGGIGRIVAEIEAGTDAAALPVEIRSYIESLVGTMQKSPAARITPAGLYDNGGRTGGI